MAEEANINIMRIININKQRSESKSPLCEKCVRLNCLINMYCSQKLKIFLDSQKLFFSYKKAQSVFREGNSVSGVYFIHNGKIKIYNTGKKSKQNIVRLVTSGEMFGLTGFDEKQYFVSASTLEDSFLCFFEKEIFIKTLKENPEFAWQLLDLFAHELSNIEIQHKNSNQLNNKEKITGVLLMLKDKF